MRARELVFGMIAIVLVIGYGALGSRVVTPFIPGSTITPTPPAPRSPVQAPRVTGTLAFSLRGDVYVLRDGKYANVTSESRNLSPSLSVDGRTLVFSRTETIDGKREVDGQVTPALLHYTDIIRKDASGGPETILVTGLRLKSPTGFHQVAFQDSPAISADGARFAVVVDEGDGRSELYVYDMKSTASRAIRIATLSIGSNLADPSWAPDGKTIAVTSYTLGAPRILLVPTDGRAATPQKISAAGEAYRPSYSPDGKWLIYTLRRPTGGNDVHAVEVASGRDVAFTSDGRSWNGVFSPDGTSVAFMRETNGAIDIYAMEIGGALGGSGGAAKDPVKLTRGEGIDGESRLAWGK